MEISFKFNNGENAQQIVAAISSLFGIISTAATAPVVYQGAAQAAPAALPPADNPAVGADPEDTGAASTATHDTEGSPWDARIHSDKKTVTDKGVWRKRKGVAPGTIAQVQAELRATGKYAAVPAPVAPSAPPAVAAPVAAPAVPQAAGIPAMPAAPTIPAAPPLPVQQPVDTPYTLFVNFVASNLHSGANPGGRLTDEWVSQALASMGVGSMVELQHADEARVKAVHNAFAQALGVPGV